MPLHLLHRTLPSSKPCHHQRLILGDFRHSVKSATKATVLSLVFISACATTPQPVAKEPEIAKVDGVRIRVEPIGDVVTTSQDCQSGEAAFIKQLPQSLKSKAEKALGENQYIVLTDPTAKADLVAKVTASVSYCNTNPKIHIVTGELTLSIEKGGELLSKSSEPVDMGGDLDAPFDALAKQSLTSKPIIKYTKKGHAKSEMPDAGE